jgi:hypothetical protein
VGDLSPLCRSTKLSTGRRRPRPLVSITSEPVSPSADPSSMASMAALASVRGALLESGSSRSALMGQPAGAEDAVDSAPCSAGASVVRRKKLMRIKGGENGILTF